MPVRFRLWEVSDGVSVMSEGTSHRNEDFALSLASYTSTFVPTPVYVHNCVSMSVTTCLARLLSLFCLRITVSM